ncbi:MAG: hypothetical protein HJJLKODD_02855 [Phycisphaerae bacterium]|nr:hypothetical protein [Phycisphaerae bacterium]
MKALEKIGADDFLVKHGVEAFRERISQAIDPLPLRPVTTAPACDQPILDPADPLPSARCFLKDRYTLENSHTLLHYAGILFVCRDNRYAPLEDSELRSELYDYAEKAVRPRKTSDGDVEYVPFQPTQAKIGNILDAIRAVTFLSACIAPPCWLDEGSELPPPHELLCCKSGTLHIPTRRWMEPTPKLFAVAALTFDYSERAPEPERWLAFLHELWSDDQQSIDTLQEWIGYCLTGDTSQQKMLLLVGPKRSGKGTIGRVLTALIGTDNIAGPTTSSLATQFGLQPLIGKTLAIVSDARFSGQPESSVVLERLLCISGEDTLTIPRKYLGDVTMKLPTRFMFLTNELPRLADSSGALAGRFVPLILQRSFYGSEDTELTRKLLAELPGILNWALEGWSRLRQRGKFVVPESSREAMQELADLGSPVAAFVRDCCTVGPGYQADVSVLYAAWKLWCSTHGREHPGMIQTFARDLKAAQPGLRRIRPRNGDDRRRAYSGIGLKSERGPQRYATQAIEPAAAEEFDDRPGERFVNSDPSMRRTADHRGPENSHWDHDDEAWGEV